jgi:hypothetical protein
MSGQPAMSGRPARGGLVAAMPSGAEAACGGRANRRHVEAGGPGSTKQRWMEVGGAGRYRAEAAGRRVEAARWTGQAEAAKTIVLAVIAVRKRSFRVPRYWAREEVLGAGYETVPSFVDPCTMYIHHLTDEYTARLSSVLVPRNIFQLYSSIPRNIKKPRKIPYFPDSLSLLNIS